MKTLAVLIFSAIVSTTARAQQQMTPSQTALAVNQAVAQMAGAIEQAQAQIAALQKQLEEANKKCQMPEKK